MKHKPSAMQVALAAGVSPATVDRVLNRRGNVSADKERKVLEWAHRLGLDRNLEVRPTRMIRIGVAMQHPSNPFYESLRLAFAKANRSFFSANIQNTVHYFDTLAPGDVAALLRKISESHDALIVISADHPVIRATLSKIALVKPVLTIGTDLPNTGRLAYIGLDNRSAGRVAGDLMGRFLGPNGGDVIVVSGLQSMVALGEREAGFRAVLAERHKSCRLVAVVETGEQRDKAGELVRETIGTHRNVVGIYNVSTGNRAIANVLRQLDRNETTILIAHELAQDRQELLREGVIDAIIDQNPELEALTAVEVLCHHFGRSETPPARMITPFTVHFRENC